jgi:hypothetical protein
MLSKNLFTTTTALASLALGSLGTAQESFGRWHATNGNYPVTFLYVTPSGSDGNSGTPSSPLRTISEAVRRANSLAAASVANPVAVSINVETGRYDQAAGESFPITMVNRGVMLEAWDTDPTVPTDPPGGPNSPLPTVRGPGGAFRSTVFDVTLLGHSLLPDSGLRGLRVELGSSELGVNILTVATEPPTVSRFLIEGCEFVFDALAFQSGAIEMITRGKARSEHRILGNLIAGTIDWTIQPPVPFPARLCTGIAEQLEVPVPGEEPASSSLVRSNTSYLLQSFYRGIGTFEKTSALAPRLESNSVQLTTTNVHVIFGEPWIANNTIAYARSHWATTLVGIWHEGPGVARIYNNIV